MDEEIYDVIIIGGGPAGLSAAIYSARNNLKTMLLEGNKLGGKAIEAHWVENYPGFPEGIKGIDLMNRVIKQMEKFKVNVRYETVVGFSNLGNIKIVTTRNGFHQSKAVIITTGVSRKQLSLPGEEEFRGRGVSYCAVCDGPFFKEKVVAVVGSGHEAVQDIELLAEITSKVYAIPGKKGYKEDFPELSRIRENSKIKIFEDFDSKEIGGNEFVEYIILENSSLKKLNINGVFIILEYVPTSRILTEAGIETDKRGCILVDMDQSTNIEGVYAAGDCSCKGMQIVTATGMGAKAALSAMKYVKNQV
jgi:thioredoxin reductase (NADPH)